MYPSMLHVFLTLGEKRLRILRVWLGDEILQHKNCKIFGRLRKFKIWSDIDFLSTSTVCSTLSNNFLDSTTYNPLLRFYKPNYVNQLMNLDNSGAIVPLSVSILILDSKCIEGARDVRILSLTPIIWHRIENFLWDIYLRWEHKF